MNISFLGLMGLLALSGVIDSTPIRVCYDECGLRVGCDFVPAEMPSEPPAYCEERLIAEAKERVRKEIEARVAAERVMEQRVLRAQQTATICFDGVLYFERTLTPVYAPRTESRLQSCDQ